VKEAAFLMAVQRIVSRVQIEDDPARRRLVRLKKKLDEQTPDCGAIVADLMVARGLGWRMLEPVQRAFAGQRSAVLALGGELAGARREYRVVAQLIVVDEILPRVRLCRPEDKLPRVRCRTRVAPPSPRCCARPAPVPARRRSSQQTVRPTRSPDRSRRAAMHRHRR
jgi:hypothetical protein